MKLHFQNAYRSIKGLQDVELDKLTVICGPNGSGKSHLLEAIEKKEVVAQDFDNNPLRAKIFEGLPALSAKTVTHADLQAIRSAAKDTLDMIDDLETLLETGKEGTNVLLRNGTQWLPVNRENLLAAMKEYLENGQSIRFHGGGKETGYKDALITKAENNRSRLDAFKKYVSTKALNGVSRFEAAVLKTKIFEFVECQNFMNIDISTVFYRYFEELQENAYLKASTSPASLDDLAFETKFGTPPWEAVNTMLAKHGFRHHFIAPNKDEDARATKGYTAKIRCEEGAEITVNDLSSGERVIIALLLSAYATQQQESKIFQLDAPDLILFDELDAHLHPSLTRMMFDVLQTSIIEKLERKVIITTHSPSTVALAPSGSVYKLTPGISHTLRPIQKEAAARELSDGFIQVIDNSQIVIVEGRDDPPFYRTIERALRSINKLATTPTLHFIPASKTDYPSCGGGSTSAEDWAKKLSETNLPNIHALLDRDKGAADNGIIKVLGGRYAIENFILDPLSLAIALITDQKLSAVDSSLGVQFSQISVLNTADEESMQNLVNGICGFIEKNTAGLSSTSSHSVKYMRGIELKLPDWLVNRRGKDLVGKVRESFKVLNKAYIITRKDIEPYNIELGYLLKLWSQNPLLFPNDLEETLGKFV